MQHLDIINQNMKHIKLLVAMFPGVIVNGCVRENFH
jgi:hypothetical protein